MIVLAVVAAGFAVRLQSAGMARALIGIAGMQVAMGALMATDPATPYIDRAIMWTGAITALWLVAAGIFRAAARHEAGPVTPAVPSPAKGTAPTGPRP